jgi:glycosyltransferase involved in cell wall biosynthesis
MSQVKVQPEESHPADDLLVAPKDDREPTISVVMPTLNEEEGIAECITRAKNGLHELGVTGEIIISDDSTDRTPEIARSMGARVVNPDKPGYGYAYRYAFERARGQYITMGDADTTYDFEQIPRLVSHLQDTDADVVMGSRLNGEIKPGAMPALHQFIGNPLLTKFLNVFYDTGVSDAHSGFRVFSKEALDQLDLQTDGMEFASEMVMKAGAQGLSVEEVPITYHERQGEAKLESFSDGWRHVKFMLVNAPGYLFSLPGIGMGLLGVLLITLVQFNVQVSGQWFGVNSMVVGCMLVLLGFQVGNFGYATSQVTNPIRAVSDPVTDFVDQYFSLERGATTGVVAGVAGLSYAVYLVYGWAQTGYEVVPDVTNAILAATFIILGVQMVFTSFFLDVLKETRT